MSLINGWNTSIENVYLFRIFLDHDFATWYIAAEAKIFFGPTDNMSWIHGMAACKSKFMDQMEIPSLRISSSRRLIRGSAVIRQKENIVDI